MEQITVKHPNGTTLDLNSYTAPSVVSSATLKSEFQGTDSIEIKVKSASPLDFYIGDSITFLGAKYTINQTPKIQKKGERDLEYTLTFEGLQYELIDRVFLLVDIDTMRDSLTGTLEDFLKILVKNANRDNAYTWSYQIDSVGIGEAEVKTESFDENNCLEVLQQLMEDFECEFRITADDASKTRVIRIGSDGTLASSSLGGYVFEYGQAGGAYELKREPADNTNIVTRLFVYGSNNNINTSENGVSVPYRSTRLCLPNKAKNESYIEDSELIDLFGVKEGIISLDDIEPACKGVVRSVTGEAGSTTFTAYIEAPKDDREYDIDFDIHDYLMPDTNASIIFQTGELAGYEFDLSGDDNNGFVIDNGYVTINFNSFYDENGMRFPYDGGASFNVQEGDEFLFNNIYFPLKRIESAEEKLQEEGQKQFDETSIPQIKYSLTVDPIWLQRREDPEGAGIVSAPFTVGNTVHVKDTALDLDDSIRISSISRDLLQEWKFTLTLADKTTPNLITKIVNSMQLQNEIIKINDLTNTAKARKNWKTSQEVLSMIFDTEGYYYSDKIAPLSIETTMLSVGARSQQFTLKDLVFQPNYNGNANLVLYSDGTLEHYTIDDLGTVIWQIEGGTVELPSDYSGAYYVYARCGKSYVVGDVNTGATILFSQEQYTFDGNDYYYFLIGMLTSIDNDTETNGGNPSRDLALTYGSTTINGRFIRTGRIQANGSDTYFDLDSGEIHGTITFTDDNGNGHTVQELTDLAYLKDTLGEDTNGTLISGGAILTTSIGLEGAVTSAQTARCNFSSRTVDITAYPDGGYYFSSTSYTLPSFSSTKTADVECGSFSGTISVTHANSDLRWVEIFWATASGQNTRPSSFTDSVTSGSADGYIRINAGGSGTFETSYTVSAVKLTGLVSGDTLRLTRRCYYGGGDASSITATVYNTATTATITYPADVGATGIVAGISGYDDPMIFAGADGWENRGDSAFYVNKSGHVRMADVEISTRNVDNTSEVQISDGSLSLLNDTKAMYITAERYSSLVDAGLQQEVTTTLTKSMSYSLSQSNPGLTTSATGQSSGRVYATLTLDKTETVSQSLRTMTVASGDIEISVSDGTFTLPSGTATFSLVNGNCTVNDYPGVSLTIIDTFTLTASGTTLDNGRISRTATAVWQGSSFGTLSWDYTTVNLNCNKSTTSSGFLSFSLKWSREYQCTYSCYVTPVTSLANWTLTGSFTSDNFTPSISGVLWVETKTTDDSTNYVSRLFSNGLLYQGANTAQVFGVMPTADLGFIASNGNGCAIEVNQASGSDYYFSQPSGISATGTGTGLWNDRGIFANNDIVNNAYGRGWVDLMPGILLVLRWNSPSEGATASNFAQWSPYKCFVNTVTYSSAGDYALGLCYSGSSVYPLVSVRGDRVTISTWSSGTGIHIQIRDSSGTLTNPSTLYLVVFRSNLKDLSC